MRLFWSLLFLSVPIFGVGLLAISAMLKHGWLPENISTHGGGLDGLFYIILAITGIVFVATELMLVWAMFTGRGNNGGKSTFVHGNRTLEITWTAVTSGILLFVALYQIPIWRLAKFQSQKPKTDVDALVTASQFLWEIRYPAWDEKANKPYRLNTLSPDLGASFQLVNELHIPPTSDAERYPVLIHLTTRDVIHSFWIPACRVKQDALPGHIIPVWFDATKPGAYEWVCAELCGWGHFRMRAKLVVHESLDDYYSWLKEQSRIQLGVGK